MLNKKFILLLIAVIGIVSSGVITHVVSEVKLGNQAMLALQGKCGTCDGTQSCSWCDSWVTGSEMCSGGSYIECFEGPAGKACGSCTAYEHCAIFYDCASPGCMNCKQDGNCDGCSAVTDGDPC